MHKHPVVIPVDQAGVPTYDELVLVVREDEARTRGQDLRAFLQALTRGERAVRAEPRRGRGAARQGQPVAGTQAAAGIDHADAARGAARRSEQAYGWQSPTAWAAFGNWMYTHGLLNTTPTAGCRRSPTSSCPGRGSERWRASAC